jgi:hypothetical protein
VTDTVPVHDGSFSRVIAEHLELQRRNSRLERTLPLEDYRRRFDRGEAAPAQPPGETAPGLGEDPPSKSARAPWDDPDSWWNVRDEPAFDWRS